MTILIVAKKQGLTFSLKKAFLEKQKKQTNELPKAFLGLNYAF